MSEPALSASACFTYDLPEERIAQRPVHPYDAAKMLVIGRGRESIQDSVFAEFHRLVRPGDLVVFNNSKVIPARLFGAVPGREGQIEVLLLEEQGSDRWRALGRPLKKIPPGTSIQFSELLCGTVIARSGEMEILIQFTSEVEENSVRELMHSLGTMPIPPYIRKGRGDEQDRVDYQPIFARLEGSVAAPTASLHFTPQVLERIRGQGAEVRELTLHVGSASFLPIWRSDRGAALIPPSAERMLASDALVRAIRDCKDRGGRVIAVGTTVVRALESMMRLERISDGAVVETDLFITPGFSWRAVDVLVTNFHQPRTTHLLLVEAFAGRSTLAAAYQHALLHGYRFLSYGDGMVVYSE